MCAESSTSTPPATFGRQILWMFAPFLIAALGGAAGAYSTVARPGVAIDREVVIDGSSLEKIAATPDLTTAGALSADGTLALWLPATPHSEPVSTTGIRDFAISPAGGWVANVAASDGSVRISRPRADLAEFPPSVKANAPSTLDIAPAQRVIFSKDGTMLGIELEDTWLAVAHIPSEGSPLRGKIAVQTAEGSRFQRSDSFHLERDERLGDTLVFSPAGDYFARIDFDHTEVAVVIHTESGEPHLDRSSGYTGSGRDSPKTFDIGGRTIAAGREMKFSSPDFPDTEPFVWEFRGMTMGTELDDFVGSESTPDLRYLVAGKDGIAYEMGAAKRWKIQLARALVITCLIGFLLAWTMLKPPRHPLYSESPLPDRPTPIPTGLKVCAGIVIALGAFSIWEMIDKFLKEDHFSFNIGMFNLFGGFALLRWDSGWRTFVLFQATLASLILGMTIGSMIPGVHGAAPGFSISGAPVWVGAIAVGILGAGAALVWVIYTLRCPEIRAHFKRA